MTTAGTTATDCIQLIHDVFGIPGDEFFTGLVNLKKKLKDTGLERYLKELLPIDKNRPTYRATIMHHLVMKDYESVDSMAYVMAIFVFLGCSFYQEDSMGESVCHMIYRRGVGLSKFITQMTRHKTEIAIHCFNASSETENESQIIDVRNSSLINSDSL